MQDDTRFVCGFFYYCIPINLDARYQQHKASGDDREIAIHATGPVDVEQAVILLPFARREQQTVSTGIIHNITITGRGGGFIFDAFINLKSKKRLDKNSLELMQMQTQRNNYAQRQNESDHMSSDLAKHQHIGQGHDLWGSGYKGREEYTATYLANILSLDCGSIYRSPNV